MRWKKTHPKKTSLRIVPNLPPTIFSQHPARRRLPTADGGRPRTDPATDTAPPSRQGRVLPHLFTVTGRAASQQRRRGCVLPHLRRPGSQSRRRPARLRARTAPSRRTSTAPRHQTLSHLLPTGSAVPAIYWLLCKPSPAGTRAPGRRRPPVNLHRDRAPPPRCSEPTDRRPPHTEPHSLLPMLRRAPHRTTATVLLRLARELRSPPLVRPWPNSQYRQDKSIQFVVGVVSVPSNLNFLK
jgi:hypothetical protein